MKIVKLRVKNFRLLKDVSMNLETTSTVIVGRNNTGKTSLTEIFRCFLSDRPSIRFEDFSMSSLEGFENAFLSFNEKKEEVVIREQLPSIDLELTLNYVEDQESFGSLCDFILDLDETLFNTIVLIKYQLKDGKIAPFFMDLNITDKTAFYKELKRRIPIFFESVLYAIDPSNYKNMIKLDFVKIKKILLANFINAQRGLDDETHNEKDVLGKSLGNIFKSASSTSAPEEFRKNSENLNAIVDKLQTKIDTDFQDKVKELLPALSIFGYPGLQDPNLSAITELNVKSLLESNTKVIYQKSEHFSLPETYNGLGFRNLIYILFRIYEYFRLFQSQGEIPKGQIIFIEEPEAHLHPQMQEVFIRQLDQIVFEFEKKLNNKLKWPVQFVVSTHSTHIANETEFDKIRYFISKNEKGTKIKDLSSIFDPINDKQDKEFVHKYLTLTKCDLYFADKAILLEGATERILMPEIIRKVDNVNSINLKRKYLSIVEIGGAYAHHFYKFLDFLELQTLIITDLDSVKTEIKPDKKGTNRTTYPAYPVFECTHSSNIGLSKWFGESEYLELEKLIVKLETEKMSNFRKLAFQIPENGMCVCGRSFEDAFILANLKHFEIDIQLKHFEKAKKAFSIAEEIAKKSKANFAIEYAITTTDWQVPKYIHDGLVWLTADIIATALNPEGTNDENH